MMFETGCGGAKPTPAIIDVDIPAEIPQSRRRGATRVGDDATGEQFSYF
jgi:hypothetical protein